MYVGIHGWLKLAGLELVGTIAEPPPESPRTFRLLVLSSVLSGIAAFENGELMGTILSKGHV